MPNWCYSTVIVSGPEDDIDRFKAACLYLEPHRPNGDLYGDGKDNGLDFQRIVPMPEILQSGPAMSFGTVSIDAMIKAMEAGDQAEIERIQKKDAEYQRDWLSAADDHPELSAHLMLSVDVRVPIMERAQRCLKAREETGFLSANEWAVENWGTKWMPSMSTYDYRDGRHILRLATPWAPPVPVFERIVQIFPTLTLTLDASDITYPAFWTGTISAAGVDVREDEEAMADWTRQMEDAADDQPAVN